MQIEIISFCELFFKNLYWRKFFFTAAIILCNRNIWIALSNSVRKTIICFYKLYMLTTVYLKQKKNNNFFMYKCLAICLFCKNAQKYQGRRTQIMQVGLPQPQHFMNFLISNKLARYNTVRPSVRTQTCYSLPCADQFMAATCICAMKIIKSPKVSEKSLKYISSILRHAMVMGITPKRLG